MNRFQPVQQYQPESKRYPVKYLILDTQTNMILEDWFGSAEERQPHLDAMNKSVTASGTIVPEGFEHAVPQVSKFAQAISHAISLLMSGASCTTACEVAIRTFKLNSEEAVRLRDEMECPPPTVNESDWRTVDALRQMSKDQRAEAADLRDKAERLAQVGLAPSQEATVKRTVAGMRAQATRMERAANARDIETDALVNRLLLSGYYPFPTDI